MVLDGGYFAQIWFEGLTYVVLKCRYLQSIDTDTTNMQPPAATNTTQTITHQANKCLQIALPPLSYDDGKNLSQCLSGFAEEAEYYDIPMQTAIQKILQLRLPNDPDECYAGDAFRQYYAWGFGESMGAITQASLAMQLRVYAIYLYSLVRAGSYDDGNAGYLTYRLVRYALQQTPKQGTAMAEYFTCLYGYCNSEKADKDLVCEDVRPLLRLSVALLAAKFAFVPPLAFGGRNGLETYMENNWLTHYVYDRSYYHSDSWLTLLNDNISRDQQQFEALEEWLINS